MNTPLLPSVELVQGAPPPVPGMPPARRRWKVFFIVLLVTAAIGVAYVYSRSPVYRTTASVLTVKPKAVDARSAEADVEHVAIQGRLLLGEELLSRLGQRLAEQGDDLGGHVDRLRGMLGVAPVPDTNLLELRAEGADPEQLQRIVNRWAEAYEDFRAQEIEAATGRTTAELEDQQAQLQTRIEAARAELQTFREANDIVSLERGENPRLAQLKGLNDSLNKARETLIAARARKLAIDEAITRGETVIPSEQKAEIAKMQLAVQRARIRMAELKQRYTQTYIERDPALRNLPNELRAMEGELSHALRLARSTVSDEAQQQIETARVAVETLEQRLAEHQRDVQVFTERFKEFKTHEENLARLDQLLADNRQRLAQIQISNFERFPPIQVVEWARVPDRPIHPDYERDLMIALGAALTLALFATWLVEYLSERPQQAQAQPYIGIRIHSADPSQALAAPHRDDYHALPGAAAAPAVPPPGLPVLPRELGVAEVDALLRVLDPTTAAHASLLLCGVSPYELPLLHAACFDRQRAALEVPGAGRRVLAIEPSVWTRLDALGTDLDQPRMALPVAELDARLRSAAGTTGLADPQGVNALALWHSYVVYLVRQGISSTDLSNRVGGIPQEVLVALRHYAPPGGTRPTADVQFTHPALSG